MSEQELVRQLQPLGWHLSPEGIAKVLELWAESGKTGNRSPTPEQLVKVALNVDLKQIGAASLPADINRGKVQSVKGPLVLQIQRMVNAAAPKVNQESAVAPRMFRLTVTDGQGTTSAIEMQPIPALRFDTPPGTKIRLKGNVSLLGGYILLDPNVVEILGGRVEDMVDKWNFSRSMAKYGTLAARKGEDGGGPPLWVPFGKKIKPGGTVNDRNFKALEEVKKATGLGAEKEGQDGEGEFELQRKAQIEELKKMKDESGQKGRKKVFGGRPRDMVDHSIQVILEQGFSKEQAESALRRCKNNSDRALKLLQRERDGKQATIAEGSGPGGKPGGRDSFPEQRGRGSKRGRGGHRFGPSGDDDAGTGGHRPHVTRTLFDFMADKIGGDVTVEPPRDPSPPPPPRGQRDRPPPERRGRDDYERSPPPSQSRGYGGDSRGYSRGAGGRQSAPRGRGGAGRPERGPPPSSSQYSYGQDAPRRSQASPPSRDKRGESKAKGSEVSSMPSPQPLLEGLSKKKNGRGYQYNAPPSPDHSPPPPTNGRRIQAEPSSHSAPPAGRDRHQMAPPPSASTAAYPPVIQSRTFVSSSRLPPTSHSATQAPLPPPSCRPPPGLPPKPSLPASLPAQAPPPPLIPAATTGNTRLPPPADVVALFGNINLSQPPPGYPPSAAPGPSALSVSPSAPFTINPPFRPGELVLAKFWQDEQYYGAEIEQVTSSSCIVRFLDYGDQTEEVAHSDIVYQGPQPQATPNGYYAPAPSVPPQATTYAHYPMSANAYPTQPTGGDGYRRMGLPPHIAQAQMERSRIGGTRGRR